MKTGTSYYYFIVEKIAVLILLVYPTGMIVLKGGMNGAFAVLLLLALATLVLRPAGMEPVVWRREWSAYTASMAALTLAIFLSQSYHGDFAFHPYDAASRYWLGVPIFLLLYRLPPSIFQALGIAFPCAAITGFVLAKDVGAWYDHRATISTMDVIHFGNIELMLGVLSAFSIAWLGTSNRALTALRLAGLGAGLAASFASGTRGGWLTIPVFAVLFLYLKRDQIPRKLILGSAIALPLAVAAVYYATPYLQHRVNEVGVEIGQFSHGQRDTSTGIRIQLYGAALDMVAHNPVFGVGPQGFAEHMKSLEEAGTLTHMAAEMGRGEVHNDILAKTVGMGIFGLIAMLGIYAVPLHQFWRSSQSAIKEVRGAATLGIVFVVGFFIFGLTVEALNLTMVTAFYSFTVAVLLAACHNTHYRVITSKPERDV